MGSWGGDWSKWVLTVSSLEAHQELLNFCQTSLSLLPSILWGSGNWPHLLACHLLATGYGIVSCGLLSFCSRFYRIPLFNVSQIIIIWMCPLILADSSSPYLIFTMTPGVKYYFHLTYECTRQVKLIFQSQCTFNWQCQDQNLVFLAPKSTVIDVFLHHALDHISLGQAQVLPISVCILTSFQVHSIYSIRIQSQI